MIHNKKASFFRKESRAILSGKWLFAAEVTLFYFAVTMLLQSANNIIPLIPLLVLPILSYGYRLSMLRMSRGEKITFEMLFEGFSKGAFTIFVTYLIVFVRIFLWSLLLIIPGIIAAYSYSQVFFILADHPEYSALEAIEKSKKMMMGNKWRYFLLSLSFIGWGILSIFTLFIAYFFLSPYISISFAKFYDSIKG
jgi:uncharacterized membrane protein